MKRRKKETFDIKKEGKNRNFGDTKSNDEQNRNEMFRSQLHQQKNTRRPGASATTSTFLPSAVRHRRIVLGKICENSQTKIWQNDRFAFEQWLYAGIGQSTANRLRILLWASFRCKFLRPIIEKWDGGFTDWIGKYFQIDADIETILQEGGGVEYRVRPGAVPQMKPKQNKKLLCDYNEIQGVLPEEDIEMVLMWWYTCFLLFYCPSSELFFIENRNYQEGSTNDSNSSLRRMFIWSHNQRLHITGGHINIDQ